MNRKFVKYLICTFFLFFICNISYGYENKILFKLNSNSFTSLDLENRKNYLKFVGENENISLEKTIEDFISVNIFYEYYLENNNNLNLDNKIEEIYLNIKNENIKNNRNQSIKFNKEIILYNLKLDYVRKIILEDFLNTKRNEIFNKEKELDLLYNYEISYINIDKTMIELDSLLQNKFKNIDNVKEYLASKNIPFLEKKRAINSIYSISKIISDKIKNNIHFFYINNNSYISFISIKKNFETFEGLIATIFSFEANNKLNNENLNCNIINNGQITFTKKDYEFNKLNEKIKNRLVSINDYIVVENNNLYTYIFLCGIKFNEEILNSININKKISYIVDIAEKEFIDKYSSKYKLLMINE